MGFQRETLLVASTNSSSIVGTSARTLIAQPLRTKWHESSSTCIMLDRRRRRCSNLSICSQATAQQEQQQFVCRDLNEYRRGVGLCVFNRQGLVFAARRMDDSMKTWQMPQGGIDPMENPLVAAKRELMEETGITNVRVVSSIDHWLDYEFPTKVKVKGTSGETCWHRYKGQTQKWLLLEFMGCDEDIDLSCHGVPEFVEWRWMRLEELPRSVVHFKREVYEHVARHFVPRIQCVGEMRSSSLI